MTASLKVRSEGFQSPIVRRAAFTHADFDGTNLLEALELPADAIISGGKLCFISAFDALTTVSVGRMGAEAELLAASDATSIGCSALSEDFDGAPLGANRTFGLSANQAVTQGEGVLIVEYIRVNRAQGTQG